MALRSRFCSCSFLLAGGRMICFAQGQIDGRLAQIIPVLVCLEHGLPEVEKEVAGHCLTCKFNLRHCPAKQRTSDNLQVALLKPGTFLNQDNLQRVRHLFLQSVCTCKNLRHDQRWRGIGIFIAFGQHMPSAPCSSLTPLPHAFVQMGRRLCGFV